MPRVTVDRLVISPCGLPQYEPRVFNTRNSDSDRIPEKA